MPDTIPHPGQRISTRSPWCGFVAGERRMNAEGHSRAVILCIDAKEAGTQLELFKQVLEKAGYRVFAFTNADEALQIFSQNHIDLVLTEHIVSTLTGAPKLTATFKRLKPDVPVAIYSADLAASPEDMQFADTFITKLVPIDELLGTIEKLLTKGPLKAVG